MNEFYASLIKTAQNLALEKGLLWNSPCDALGKVNKLARWNLTSLCGVVPPPTLWLSDHGYDDNCLPALARILNQTKGGTGTIGGLMNFLNNMMGVIAPIVTGILVAATHNFAVAFLVAGLVLLVGIFFYIVVLGRIEPIPSPE